MNPKIFSLFANGYSFKDFRADFIAGLTVAVVALPLSMALGIASGSSPDKGLLTAVIAGFLVSFFGGSRVQIGGPTGAFVVVIFNVIAQHGYEGLMIATLMAGCMLIFAGYAKFGQIIKFIPQPVVTGFTAGIAVIIASTQVKNFLGLHLDSIPSEFIPQWKAYFTTLHTLNPAALFLGLATLLSLIAFQKYFPKWPRYLIVMVIFSCFATLLKLPIETIGSRFPNSAPGIPMPRLPEFTFDQIQQLLPSAFTIAFLAGIEALLSAVVADGMTGFKHRSNQELIGQGIANIGSALFTGLPATGAIARTATNIASGGRTPIAGICHALFVLLFMLFGMDLIQFIPMTVLSAVLYLVAWGMSETHHFIRIFQLSKADRFILILTFLLTIFVDLTIAIGAGIILASLLFMVQMSEGIEISQAPKEFNKKVEIDQRAELPLGVEAFWIAGPIFFGMTGELLNILKRIGHKPKVLIIRMRLVPYLDATGASALIDLIKQCHKNQTEVIFSSIQKQPANMLSKFQKQLKDIHLKFAPTYEDAILLSKELILY